MWRFWDQLREGRSVRHRHVQRFPRVGGRSGFRRATTRFFDSNGRLTKIVKYATDVTANMEARSVAIQASEETIDNVQSVTDASRDDQRVRAGDLAQHGASKAVVDDIHGRAGEANAATERLQSRRQRDGRRRRGDRGDRPADQPARLERDDRGRAGRRGRQGFAVVATEVKELAGQAAAATAQISGEVAGMQAVSSEVAANLRTITVAIDTISAHVDGSVAPWTNKRGRRAKS